MKIGSFDRVVLVFGFVALERYELYGSRLHIVGIIDYLQQCIEDGVEPKDVDVACLPVKRALPPEHVRGKDNQPIDQQ